MPFVERPPDWLHAGGPEATTRTPLPIVEATSPPAAGGHRLWVEVDA